MREIFEELGITLPPSSFIWEKTYPAQKDPDQKSFFMVAKILKEDVDKIELTEGQRWDLFDQETFFKKENVIEALKNRFNDYLNEK